METATIAIAAFSLLFSVTTFFLSTRQQKRLAEAHDKLEKAMFDIERDTKYEARLAEWPAAFKFHGIDLEAAKREDLTPEQITYLIVSIGAMVSYCSARNCDLRQHLETSDYRRRMFAQPYTRRAWKYARLCIDRESAKVIDAYLREKHAAEYDPL